MSWYLYLAFKQLFPSGRLVSFFSVMSILGVTLGVMILVIVLSVMNGFGEQIQRKIIETHGHIRVENNYVLKDYEPIIDAIKEESGIEEVAPYAHGMVMLQNVNIPTYPFIRGIDLTRKETVIPVERLMIEGKFEDLNNDSVILSSGLARKIDAAVGDVVQVYSPTIIESLQEDEVVLPMDLEVVGIFESGWNPVDSNTVLTSLSVMQDLYGLRQSIHGIAVKLKSNAERQLDTIATQLQSRLDQKFSGLQVMTWYEANKDFMFILKLEKTLLFFIIIFVILVASFSIACSLMTTVVRKVREIGILGAIGAKPWEIAMCFGLQGFIIGTLGTVLGVLGGLLGLYFRNDIVHFFAKLTQSEAALLRFYQFADIPVHYLWSDFMIVGVLSIVIATVAGIIPAIKASKLKPSEALRNE